MNWYRIHNEAAIPSPAILLFPDRIRANIQQMLAVAGGPARLRPHVKTHKLPQVIRMQVEAGISRFKCATLAEAAMVADNGGADILMAYPLYGPASAQLLELARQYPAVRFAALVDHAGQAAELERQAEAARHTLDVLIDLNVGMERTGIRPGPEAAALYRQLANASWLRPCGLHVYDGHLGISDPESREDACNLAFEPVRELIRHLDAAGLHPDELVCGGTPTFPIHAKHPERTLSPGTVLLWDWGYHTKFTDLAFQHAAVLFTRVVSKPAPDKICLDLGHKAVASEMAPPRVHLFGIPAYEHLTHSEEHLVIRFDGAERFAPGDVLYGIPTHICPTMALHDFVWAVSGQNAVEKWYVTARTREIKKEA